MGFLKKISKAVVKKVLPKPAASVVQKLARAVGQPALNIGKAAVMSKITQGALGAGSFIPGPIGLGFKAGSLATKAIKTSLMVGSAVKSSFKKKPSVQMAGMQFGSDWGGDQDLAERFARTPVNRLPNPSGPDYAQPWRDTVNPFSGVSRLAALRGRRRVLDQQQAAMVEDTGAPGGWGRYGSRRVWMNRATGQWQVSRRRSKRPTVKQLKKAIALIKREKKQYGKILGALGMSARRRGNSAPPPWVGRKRRW